MERRAFLALVPGLLAAPLAAGAQQAGKVYRIGVLTNISPREFPAIAVFERRMSELGYIEGKNLTIEFGRQPAAWIGCQLSPPKWSVYSRISLSLPVARRHKPSNGRPARFPSSSRPSNAPSGRLPSIGL
jgi:hypothetical protein